MADQCGMKRCRNLSELIWLGVPTCGRCWARGAAATEDGRVSAVEYLLEHAQQQYGKALRARREVRVRRLSGPAVVGG